MLRSCQQAGPHRPLPDRFRNLSCGIVRGAHRPALGWSLSAVNPLAHIRDNWLRPYRIGLTTELASSVQTQRALTSAGSSGHTGRLPPFGFVRAKAVARRQLGSLVREAPSHIWVRPCKTRHSRNGAHRTKIRCAWFKKTRSCVQNRAQIGWLRLCPAPVARYSR
jgi:hypothetical protein